MNIFTSIYLLLASLMITYSPAERNNLEGAWQTIEDDKKTVLIFADHYFSITKYRATDGDFISTEGGTYQINGKQIKLDYQFNTADTTLISTSISIPFKIKENVLRGDFKGKNSKYNRIDNGTVGALHGAHFFAGRMRDGELIAYTPGSRRTLKILSGSRFQWVAYDIDSKRFMGTGGGTYTTEDGKYVENIEFFSRDIERVGARLEFNYEIKEGKWHHSGLNSRGEPLYELWARAGDLGL